MATEAEATREARAKVIAAEGEMKASRALKEASDVINQSPAALQVYNVIFEIILHIELRELVPFATLPLLTPFLQ